MSAGSRIHNIRLPDPIDTAVRAYATANGLPVSTAIRVLAEAGLSPDAQQRLCEAQEAARANGPIVAAVRDLEAALGRLRAVAGWSQ